MSKIKKRRKIMNSNQQVTRLKASAFLSAILLLFASITFITCYQQIFMKNLENNLLLLRYLNY